MTGAISRDIYDKITALGARLDRLCERVQELEDEVSTEEVLIAECPTDDNGDGVAEDLSFEGGA